MIKVDSPIKILVLKQWHLNNDGLSDTISLMKWNEMKWNEMKWNENEMKWNEMNYGTTRTAAITIITNIIHSDKTFKDILDQVILIQTSFKPLRRCAFFVGAKLMIWCANEVDWLPQLMILMALMALMILMIFGDSDDSGKFDAPWGSDDLIPQLGTHEEITWLYMKSSLDFCCQSASIYHSCVLLLQLIEF